MLLHLPRYFEQVIERIGTDSFRDADLRQIFSAMMEHGADAGPDVLAEQLSGDAVVIMQELLEENGGLDHSDETVAGSISSMRERDITERLGEIDVLLPLADADKKDELIAEKRSLMKDLGPLGGRWWKKFR